MPGSVTIIKEVQALDGSTASTEAFTYTTSNLGVDNFSLIDNDEEPADRLVNSGIFLFNEQNAISVMEDQKHGWALTEIECTEIRPTDCLIQTLRVDPGRQANIIVRKVRPYRAFFRSQQLARHQPLPA